MGEARVGRSTYCACILFPSFGRPSHTLQRHPRRTASTPSRRACPPCPPSMLAFIPALTIPTRTHNTGAASPTPVPHPSQQQHAVLNHPHALPPPSLAPGRHRPRLLPYPGTFILRPDPSAIGLCRCHQRRSCEAAPLSLVHEPDHERGALDFDGGERRDGVAAGTGGAWHDVWVFG